MLTYIGWAIFAAIAILAVISILLSQYYMNQLWLLCRTEKAKDDPAISLFVPWWPWLDGMVTEQGVWLRKQYLIASSVAFGLIAVDVLILWVMGWLRVIIAYFST